MNLQAVLYERQAKGQGWGGGRQKKYHDLVFFKKMCCNNIKKMNYETDNLNLNCVIFAAISTYLLWHKVSKNSRYTEGYACEFLKTFYQQHLSTSHLQKSLNSG
jgi:hypothetical protein